MATSQTSSEIQSARREVASARAATSGTSGFVLGRMAGVEIRVDWSLLLIFGLVLFNLGAGAFPSWHPNWSPLLTWTVALVAALLFFASVLVHELSHALVARRRGIPVERITLFLFGGVAHLEKEPESPKDEFWMAIVGPITSLVIGFGAGFLGTWLASRSMPAGVLYDPMQAEATLHSVGPVATLLLWLGPINVVLGLFNMIPGFPLDGGRVFRSLLWWRTGDLVKATRWASFTGRMFAWFLMGVGVVNLFRGNPAQGIWLLLIGWFLHNAAAASYEQLLVKNVLADVPVRQLMRREVESVTPDITIDELVRRFMSTEQRAFPVQDDDHFLGIVCVDDVRRLSPGDYSRIRVDQIMTPIDRVKSLPTDADAEQALDELARRDVDQIPIVDHGRVVGFVRRTDVVKWIALHGAKPLAA